MGNKKLENKKNRLLTGFTIIELIVVIAIIAVLSAIIMVNVTIYIKKSKDTAIRGNLVSLISRGTAYFENNNGNYNSFCTHVAGGAPIKTAIEATNVGGAFNCNCNVGSNACTATSTKWCACSKLNNGGGNVFCVDSTGVKRMTTTGTPGTPIACSAVCPPLLAPGACNITN